MSRPFARREKPPWLAYASDRFQMGDIVSFHYAHPRHAGAKNVLLLTTNWMGNLHGLKIEYMTPTEQEYLQMVCRSIKSNKSEFYAPLEGMMQDRLQQLEVLKKQTTDLIQKQRAVVVKPVDASGGLMGYAERAAMAAKAKFGSVFNKIRTWGRSQTEQVPQGQNPQFQQQIELNNKRYAEIQQEYHYYSEILKSQKALFAQIGKIPDNPYHFYHSVIKSLVPRNRRPTMYRKYKAHMVSRERIIRSVGI